MTMIQPPALADLVAKAATENHVEPGFLIAIIEGDVSAIQIGEKWRLIVAGKPHATELDEATFASVLFWANATRCALARMFQLDAATS